MHHWWLSFADADRPKGEQFLGVAIVPAHDLIGAIKVSHALGCNPGGQVLGQPLDPPRPIPPEHLERLLDRDAIGRLEALMTEVA